MKKGLLVLITSLMLSVSSLSAAQPNMDKTLDHLHQAHKFLKNASANKGGHRAKALKLIEEAIEEVKAGKKFAATHK